MNQDPNILMIAIGLCILPVSICWLRLGLQIFSLITSRPRMALWLYEHVLVMDLLLLALGGPILWYQFVRGRFYTDSERED